MLPRGGFAACCGVRMAHEQPIPQQDEPVEPGDMDPTKQPKPTLTAGGLHNEKPGSQAEPLDPAQKDPHQRPKQDKGLDPRQSSRTPDSEPPKDKRLDDL
jgi:hypothetical protein